MIKYRWGGVGGFFSERTPVLSENFHVTEVTF